MPEVSESNYICVECGAPAPSLYKRFHNDIVKLSKCDRCKSNVDSYVEYDNVLILLDLLLHKTKAFRHLLFNRNYCIQWRLSLLYALSDTYIRWQCLPQCSDFFHLPFFDWYVIASAQFFTLLGVTFCEYFVNLLVTTMLLFFSSRLTDYRNDPSMNCSTTTPTTKSSAAAARVGTTIASTKSTVEAATPTTTSAKETQQTTTITTGVAQNNPGFLWCTGFVVKLWSISSYGKLYNVAVHVWGGEERLMLILITKVFVLTSNIQAVLVALPGLKRCSCIGVFFGFCSAEAVSWLLQMMSHPFMKMNGC